MKAADAAAPFLFNFEELSAEKLEGVGEFTGERLLARRPDAYQAIIRMSAEGLSISAQARALGVSRNTVCAVRDREGFSIEQDKKDLLRDVRRAARLSVERAIELVPGIQSAKDAAIVAAVMIDKMQLLSGEATSRVEKVEVNQDKLSEMLASLPVLEAEVLPDRQDLEVLPVTGPHGSGSGQKGLPGVGAGSGSGCHPELVSDTESEVSNYAGGLRVATLGTTCAVEPVEADARPVDQEGGRGSGFSDTPPMTPTDLGEQKILCKGVSASQEAAEELSTN